MNTLNSRWQTVAFAVAIVSLVSVLYAAGLQHQLIFDDRWATDNPALLSAPIAISASFRSLSVASFQAIFQWVGPELQWQRIFNICLHLLNGGLLWGVTAALVRHALNQEAENVNPENLSEFQGQSQMVSAAAASAALLWLVNPVAVYGVQYLTQRSIVMATSFVLLCIWAVINALKANASTTRWLWWCTAGLTYLLAMMSKEHAAPAVALTFPLWIFMHRPTIGQVWRRAALMLVPLSIAAVWMVSKRGISFGLVYEELSASFIQQLENLQPGITPKLHALSVVNQLWLFIQYGIFWNIPWPGWMSVDMRPSFPLAWHSFPQIVGPVLWIGAILGSGWALLKSSGRVALIGLLVSIPILFFASELVYVRVQEPFVLYRSYLWSIALPGLWAIGLMYVLKTKRVILAASILVAVVLSVASFERINSLYDETFAWRDALGKLDINASPNVLGRWRAPLNISHAEINRGNYKEALRHAQLAEKLGAPDGLAKFNAGSALFAMGNPTQALPLLQAAVQEGYKEAEIWVTIGGVLDQLNRVDEAFSAYDKALSGSLKPDRRLATLNQAARFAGLKSRFDKSEAYYQQILKIQPDSTLALIGVAHSLFKQGQAERAKQILSEAIDVRQSPELYHARGMLSQQMGRRQVAIQDLLEAVSRDPQNPNYKIALQKLQVDSAIEKSVTSKK